MARGEPSGEPFRVNKKRQCDVRKREYRMGHVSLAPFNGEPSAARFAMLLKALAAALRCPRWFTKCHRSLPLMRECVGKSTRGNEGKSIMLAPTVLHALPQAKGARLRVTCVIMTSSCDSTSSTCGRQERHSDIWSRAPDGKMRKACCAGVTSLNVRACTEPGGLHGVDAACSHKVEN